MFYGAAADHLDNALSTMGKNFGLAVLLLFLIMAALFKSVWDAAIAQLYFVTNTPTGLLVDGDSGAILASGQDLLGDRLAQTLAKFLHKR